MSSEALFESRLRSLPLLHRGKVRDNYAIGDDRLLIVASDRLSAFDVVLPDPIPGKGRVLTAISNFWFARTRHIVANHLTGEPLSRYLPDAAERAPLEGRSVVVQRLKPLPIEAVVRGYLIGSGWKDYQRDRRGLRDRAAVGARARRAPARADLHAGDQGGRWPARRERLLRAGRGHRSAARSRCACANWHSRSTRSPRTTRAARGILIADTKFEFGLDPRGEVVLMDEALTPDSSRFWPADSYREGASPPSLRQAVRPRLPRDARLGQARRPGRGCRPR